MSKYVAKFPNAKGMIEFDELENHTWSVLYKRQVETIKGRACDEFIEGVTSLGLEKDKIPQIPALNNALKKTGWVYVPVNGTIDVDEFFKMLMRREFPVANFIRTPEELDYLKQPDIFHEYFGHGPLLMNQVYADFVQWYGETAQQVSLKKQRILSRLFWFTIEFGLIQSPEGLRVMGGGILSSHAETLFSLESDKAKRTSFDLSTILATPYDYQSIQTEYFILESWDQLYQLQHSPELMSFLEGYSGDQDAFVVC